MSAYEVITLVAMIIASGWLSAWATQALKQAGWRSSVKLLVSGGVALAIAFAGSWLSGELQGVIDLWASGSLTAEQVFTYFVTIFTASQAWYLAAFRGTPWAENLLKWPNGG